MGSEIGTIAGMWVEPQTVTNMKWRFAGRVGLGARLSEATTCSS